MKIASRKSQPVVFILVGGATFAIEFCAFYLLWVFGVDERLAAFISYLVPGIFNYYAHCLLTFGRSPSFASATRYLWSVGINTLIHMGIFMAAAGLLQLPPYYAKAIAMILTTLCNFFVQKHFTFRHEG